MHVADLTLELAMCPASRCPAILDLRLRCDPSRAFLVQFNNMRGDPVKKLASSWFPALHFDIHSRRASAMLVRCAGEGIEARLLGDAEKATWRR